MLGHEDIGDQAARLAADGPVEALGQEVPPLVVRQKRQPPIAREGQLGEAEWDILIPPSGLGGLGNITVAEAPTGREKGVRNH